MFFTKNLQNITAEILQKAEKKNIKITLAESCTGGLLSALFTEIQGSSKVFERGFIVYSNEAKQELLQVRKELLDNFGAVSEQVCVAMAQGAIKNSHAQIALAITGIAGPDGGSKEKPVGLVYIAALNTNNPSYITKRKFNFAGNRSEVKKQVIIEALHILLKLI